MPSSICSAKHKSAFRMMSAILLGLMTSDAQANLLTNGSFETRTPAFSGWYLPLNGGDTSINGWTVTGKGIDYYNTFWPAADGNYSIDLNGSGGNTPGGLTQSFATEVGKEYFVSFWLGANGGPHNPQRANIGVQSGATFFGSVYSIPWIAPPPNTFMVPVWNRYFFSFVANSNTSTMVFQSQELEGDGGVTVDNVSVTEVVPEPSTLALICMVLLSLMGLRQMRFGFAYGFGGRS